MELKFKDYVMALCTISFMFFIIIAQLFETAEPYRDLILTIAVVHFVMSTLFTIQKEEKESGQEKIVLG